jgi:hypothetical protein
VPAIQLRAILFFAQVLIYLWWPSGFSSSMQEDRSGRVTRIRRLSLALTITTVVAMASTARAEFVARAKDFKCLDEFAPVPGKSFRIYHRNAKKLARAVRIAALDSRHRKYPVGTIIQVFPFEAMVKRGGGFNPEGGGWEFFNLKVKPGGTRIVGRTQNEQDGKPLKKLFGACQDIRCHGANQVKPYDRVCEGHVPALSLTDEEIQALRIDPRCP